MDDCKKCELITELSVKGFYLDDLRLYLDTHPRDFDALALYHDCTEAYSELRKKYIAKYGPLNYYDPNGLCDKADCWLWVQGSWPWEGEC